MSVSREDLVGFALGALAVDETERVREAVAGDPALAAELKRVERHLALHDRVPEIRPGAGLWRGIETRLHERPAPRPLVARYWMPLAAAALVAVAFLWPQERPRLQRLHGAVTATGKTCTAHSVARVALGDGVVLTLDDGTTVEVLGPQRLALRAGRLFLEVAPGRRGFAVETGELEAVTTGTAFLVQAGEPALVWTESGAVRCSWRGTTAVAGPGETFVAGSGPPPRLPRSPREWFRRPTLTTRILDRDTIRVVIRNEMPDAIDVAPPTSGEPLFFASYGGHDVPLAPDDFAPRTLAPGTDASLLLRLPRPVGEDETLVLSYPSAGVRVEATR